MYRNTVFYFYNIIIYYKITVDFYIICSYLIVKIENKIQLKNIITHFIRNINSNYFPVVFAANFFGQPVVEKFLSLMPTWLTHSFEIIGGILPALGFAITIMVIGKKSLLPYFIGGFFAVLYLKVDVMAMAIFGTCLAFLIKGFANKEDV